MTPIDFMEIWESLGTPASNQRLEAREVSPSSGVWVARDSANHQHLLVLVGAGAKLEVEETHGLSVRIASHRIAGRDDALYVDFACLEPGRVQTFATVAADIANAVAEAPAELRLSSVMTVVREWQWFWGVDPNQLSRSDAVGLLGELWFLHRWAGVTPASIQAWTASSGSRHDFQWLTSSVEVKTTAKAGPATHTIEHLEQLDDPVKGDLYLFSLRIARDTLAANSVSALANAAKDAVRDDPATRADLLNKLAARGYTPIGQGESESTYRVIDEGLYRVANGFPRLTRGTFSDGLPQGIVSVSYQLDMTACEPWRSNVQPNSWTP